MRTPAPSDTTIRHPMSHIICILIFYYFSILISYLAGSHHGAQIAYQHPRPAAGIRTCNGHIIFIFHYFLILILHCYGYMCHVCMERQAHPANDRATCVFHGNHFYFLSFFNFNFSCSHGRNGMPKCPYRGQFGLQLCPFLFFIIF